MGCGSTTGPSLISLLMMRCTMCLRRSVCIELSSLCKGQVGRFQKEPTWMRSTLHLVWCSTRVTGHRAIASESAHGCMRLVTSIHLYQVSWCSFIHVILLFWFRLTSHWTMQMEMHGKG